MSEVGKRKSLRHALVDIGACVACGTCVDVCPREAMKIFRGSFAQVQEENCVGCGICAMECPAAVISVEARA